MENIILVYFVWFMISIIINIFALFEGVMVEKLYDTKEFIKEYKKSYRDSDLRYFWNILFHLVYITFIVVVRVIATLPIMPWRFLFLFIYDNRYIICKIFFKKGCK